MRRYVARVRRWVALLLVGLSLVWVPGFLQPSFAESLDTAGPPSTSDADYRLGVADKVRIMVYNEPTLTGEYLVNANGSISFPLIGDIPAAGQTATQVKDAITAALADGYLRQPQVSIDILSYRPFFILGEVNKPGEYPYERGISVLKAVAAASGFTYRADQRHVFVKRAGQSKETEYDLAGDVQIQPGDTVRVRERFF